MQLKDLSANTYAEIMKMNQAGAIKILLEVHLSDSGSTVRRRVSDPANLEFGGETYYASNFTPSGFQVSRISQIDSVSIEYRTQDLHDDINNGYFAGASGKLILVFTNLLTETNADLQIDFATVTYSRGRTLQLTLAAENPSQKPSPSRRYDVVHCDWGFKDAECPYAPVVITGVTLSGSSEVSVTAAGHGLSTGSIALIETPGGITGGLAGAYTVTYVSSSVVTLNGTDSSDYGGAYISGGLLGFNSCSKIITDCAARDSVAGLGCFPGLNQGGDRLAY